MSKMDIYSQYISRQQHLSENSLVSGQKLISEREVLINRLMAEGFTSKQINYLLNEMPQWARSAFGDAFADKGYTPPEKKTSQSMRARPSSSPVKPTQKPTQKTGQTTSSTATQKSTPPTTTATGPKVGGSEVTSSVPQIRTQGTYSNPSMKSDQAAQSSVPKNVVSSSKVKEITAIAKSQENKPDTTTTPKAGQTTSSTTTQSSTASSTRDSAAMKAQKKRDSEMPSAI